MKHMVKTETVDGQPLLVDPLSVQAVSTSWHEDKGTGERIDTATLHFTAYHVVLRWDVFRRHFRDSFDIF